MSIRDGFSSVVAEPVASCFQGLRTFRVDNGELQGSRRDDEEAGIPKNGGVVSYPRIGSLRGIFRTQYVWGPGINTAQCLRSNPLIASTQMLIPRIPFHKPPVPQCDCGFWAYTSASTLPVSGGGALAFGIIQGWGSSIIGPRGFRAQKARIIALTIDWMSLLDAVKAHYPHVPFYPSVESMVEAYPPSDLTSLLPESEN